MRYTPSTMTLYRWKMFRRKGLVRCETCGTDLWPSKKYVRAFDDTVPSTVRLLCQTCGEREEKEGRQN